jgi:hypothetical protein
MTLDKTKKYKMCGLVWGYDNGHWWADGIQIGAGGFQALASMGNVTEFREPMTIEVSVKVSTGFCFQCTSVTNAAQASGKTFRGTLTEVIE